VFYSLGDNMEQIQVLKEIEQDYDCAIEQLHQITIDDYSQLCMVRGKRARIRELIKQLSGKK
jgi:predicted transcriptional regulator of viral defense system